MEKIIDIQALEGAALVPATVQLAPVALAPAVIAAKQAALRVSAGIITITDKASLDALSDAFAQIKGLRKLMEGEHAKAKAPVLAFTRELDALKRDYTGDLETEERRLSLLLGAHQERERRKAEEARRAAEAEAERIRAAAAAAESERIRQEHEKGRSGTLVQDVAAIRADSLVKEAEVLASASGQADTLTGATVRKSWDFEVYDVAALYAAYPDLVTLTPNKAAIKAIVKTGKTLAGVRAWAETLGSVRAALPTVAQIAASAPAAGAKSAVPVPSVAPIPAPETPGDY